ncbi:hypothetical protein AAZX31_18G192600 [Glycine max]
MMPFKAMFSSILFVPFDLYDFSSFELCSPIDSTIGGSICLPPGIDCGIVRLQNFIFFGLFFLLWSPIQNARLRCFDSVFFFFFTSILLYSDDKEIYQEEKSLDLATSLSWITSLSFQGRSSRSKKEWFRKFIVKLVLSWRMASSCLLILKSKETFSIRALF